MSLPPLLLPPAPSTSGGAKVSTLSHRQVEVLSQLLYENRHELYSKSYGTKTLALSVNEICLALIQAYASVFEARLGGNPHKPTGDILRDRHLTVCFSVKGSTVANLLTDQDISGCDLDTTLDFSQIPVPLTVPVGPESVRTFFSSPQGRICLRDFYFAVSFDATKRLLRIDNAKIMIKNIALKAAGKPEIPLKTESEIEHLKDKFFNNLLLFAGNSTFLITFGSIDFAIKVPFMFSLSSVHKADALEISIPVNPFTCNLIHEISTYHSPYTLEEATGLLRDKTISIADPHAIQFNGFERIVYALTQGWTVLNKQELLILLVELFSRTTPEAQSTTLPLERFYALLSKKKTISRVSESFCLRMFLNAYFAILEYVKDGHEEAVKIADVFHEAFLRREFRELFPSFLNDSFNTFGDLNHLLSIEKLRLGLQPVSQSMPLHKMHLEKPALILGKPEKAEGSLIVFETNLTDSLVEFGLLQSNLSIDVVNRYLSAELKTLEDFDLSIEQKVTCLLFRNMLNRASLNPEIERDVISYFPRILSIINDNPAVLRDEGMKEALISLISKHHKFLGISESDLPLLLTILPIKKNKPIIPLFFEVLSQESDEAIRASIAFSLDRAQQPVILVSLIRFMLSVEDSMISDGKRFKIIEQAFKAAKLDLPAEVCYHPKMLKMLLDPAIQGSLDIDFWVKTISYHLINSYSPLLDDIHFSLCSTHPVIFERTVELNHGERGYNFLKKLLKDGRGDLAEILLSRGLPFESFIRLYQEDKALFHSAALKQALSLLSFESLSPYINFTLASSDPSSFFIITSFLDMVEIAPKLFPIIDQLVSWASAFYKDARITHPLLKLILSLPPNEHNAILGLRVSASFDLSIKIASHLLRQFVDKFATTLLTLEEGGVEESIHGLIINCKKQSIELLAQGARLHGRWTMSCESLRWESNTLEECVHDYLKKPSEPLAIALLSKLQKRHTRIDHESLVHLKDIFKMSPLHLVELMQHIAKHYPDIDREKWSKDIYPLLTCDVSKQQFFHLYVSFSESFKHLSTILQAANLSGIEPQEAIDILEKLFPRLSDDIKIVVLNKFKDSSCLRMNHVDALFDFFKRIESITLKKNFLFDYFVSQFIKLSLPHQYEILTAPLIAHDEAASLTSINLIHKAIKDPKGVEQVLAILNKRNQEGFHIKTEDLLSTLHPIFETVLGRYKAFDPRYQEIAVRFIEKILIMFKEHEGSIPLGIYDRLLRLLEDIPMHDQIRDAIVLDLGKIPDELIVTFLQKRKSHLAYSKIDGDRFCRIFRHLVGKAAIDVIFDQYHAFSINGCFNETQKKELTPLIIAACIQEKKLPLLTTILGTKSSLGFLKDKTPLFPIDYLPSVSKAAKKLISDALSDRLSESTELKHLSLEVYQPLKIVIDTIGEEPFEEVKALTKNKILHLLNQQLKQITTIDELDRLVMNPFKTVLSYFDPCEEINGLFKAILSKFLEEGEKAITDTDKLLNGFVHILFPLTELTALRGITYNKPVVNLSNQAFTDEILEILAQKLLKLDPSVSFIAALKKLRDFKHELVLPFIRKISHDHPDYILNFVRISSETDMMILFKSMRDCPEVLAAGIASIIFERSLTEKLSPLCAYACHVTGFNLDLSKEFIKIHRDRNLEALEKDLMSLKIDYFALVLSRMYNPLSEADIIFALLEKRRHKEGLSIFSFSQKIKEHSATLLPQYLLSMPKEVFISLFGELEEARASLGKSILGFSDNLSFKDTLIANLYFTHHSESNMGQIIDELKASSFEDYFQNFLVIYNFWITKGVFTDVYPVILENAFSRIQSLVDEHAASGYISALKNKALYDYINTLCLCYQTVFPETGFPMGELFNPLLLRSLNCLLDPKNILNNQLGFTTLLCAVFHSISSSQLNDLLQPRYADELNAIFRSLVRFSSINLRDYFKKGSLTRQQYDNTIQSLTLLLETTKNNIMVSLLKRWVPKLIENGLDLTTPIVFMEHRIRLDSMTKGFKKSYLTELIKTYTAYLEAFKKEFVPKKPEAIVESLLELIDDRRVQREPKEHNAMVGLYERPKDDLDDFVFHSCMRKLKQAKEILDT
jgi:hypothetical protein